MLIFSPRPSIPKIIIIAGRISFITNVLVTFSVDTDLYISIKPAPQKRPAIAESAIPK